MRVWLMTCRRAAGGGNTVPVAWQRSRRLSIRCAWSRIFNMSLIERGDGQSGAGLLIAHRVKVCACAVDEGGSLVGADFQPVPAPFAFRHPPQTPKRSGTAIA